MNAPTTSRLALVFLAALLAGCSSGTTGTTSDPGTADTTPDVPIIFDPGPKDPGTKIDYGSEDPGWPDLGPADAPAEVEEVAVDTGPDLPDGEVPCVPNCEDRECGPDGCGELCGYCTYGNVCNDLGMCVPLCFPQCEGKQCGDDGCGSQCGGCKEDEHCTDDGQCEPNCVIDCKNKQCGSDGCGGSCGECAETDYCNDVQWCVPLCVPNCAGKKCGDDGCGGSCGECTAKQFCNDQFLCENSCKPQCTDKICGPDGCEGVCGLCGVGEMCLGDGTKCVALCVADCEDKQCGADGCGGTCGTCASGEICSPIYQHCYPKVCTPDCTGRVCGDNGCGSSCGDCGFQQVCSDAGACVDGPCKGIDPLKGTCDGDLAKYCVTTNGKDSVVWIDCAAKNQACGYDPWAGKYACVDKVCTPQCTWPDGSKKECGDDGCFGSCGTCPYGWACQASECRPVSGAPCGYIGTEGYCWDDEVLYMCEGVAPNMYITLEDCGAQGKVCDYYAALDIYLCKNP